MEELTHILVFKTDIKTDNDKMRVAELFKENNSIEEWHVDCEDVDCVLRIVSFKLSPYEIVKLINRIGFQCQELE